MSNQPTKARAYIEMEVESDGQPIKEGEVGPKKEARANDQPIEEVPVPSLDSINIPPEVELILEIEEI